MAALKLKHIDIRSTYIVNGFIRKSRQLLSFDSTYYNVPSGVVDICMIYYCEMEQFSEYGEKNGN